MIYNEQGMNILENNIATLIKQSTGGIDEKRTLKRSHIKESQNIFEDMLEVYGFYKGQYGAFKF